jgi:hypothetical protein
MKKVCKQLLIKKFLAKQPESEPLNICPITQKPKNGIHEQKERMEEIKKKTSRRNKK